MQNISKLLLFVTPIFYGCSLQTVEQHNETLNALNEIRAGLESQLSNIEQTAIAQQTEIQQLDEKMQTLSSSVNNIQASQKQALNLAKNNQPQEKIVYVEKEIPMTSPANEDKLVLGEKEWIWLDIAQRNYRARVDTGATTSSINATEIQEFERDGKTWVRFTLADQETPDDTQTVETPVKRWVRIRQSSVKGTTRRPVIELRIQLGPLQDKTQFTLTDRSHMDYPVLLGRSFFKDIALVDVGRDYIYPKKDIPETSKASSAKNESPDDDNKK